MTLTSPGFGNAELHSVFWVSPKLANRSRSSYGKGKGRGLPGGKRDVCLRISFTT